MHLKELGEVVKMYIEKDCTYSHISLEMLTYKEGNFRGGKLIRANSGNSLIVKIEKLGKDELYYGTSKMECIDIKESYIKKLIESAKDDSIRVPIVIPKKIVFPKRSYIEKELELLIPKEIQKELKSITTTEKIVAEYKFVHSRRYHLDSNDVEIYTENPTFFIDLGVEVFSPNEVIDRRIGIRPENVDDIRNVRRLLKYLPDITLEQEFKDSQSFEDLSKNLMKIATKIKRKRVNISNGLYDVIFPFTIGVHEIFGHVSEAEIVPERKLSTELSENESKYKSNKLFKRGMQVSSEKFSVVDDPKYKFSNLGLFGGFNFDMEMFPASKKCLIKDGMVTGEMLGSKYSFGGSVGNAKCSSIETFPIPRMSTTVVIPSEGPKSMDEMIEMASKKLLITNRGYGYVNTNEAVFCIGTDDGNYIDSLETYLYENGNLIPVKTPHILTGSIYQTLYNFQLSNKELYYVDTLMCGKNTPLGEDYVPVSIVAPLALLHNIQVVTYTLRYQRI